MQLWLAVLNLQLVLQSRLFDFLLIDQKEYNLFDTTSQNNHLQQCNLMSLNSYQDNPLDKNSYL